MPLFFLGTREWRNRQTRTVQVRVPVMEWGFNSPLAHDETADPSGSAVFVFPGCGLWPRWCSGRRRARLWGRAALWGPAAVCAGGRRPAREIATRDPAARSGRSRGPPWPCRRPPAPRPGPAAHGRRSQAPPPPTGTAADPSGALHTGGAWLLMCYWVRCFEARPGLAPRSVPYPQFRMQFPDTCSSSLSEKPGISTITFQSMKCVRGIACEFLGQRAH